MGKVARGRSIAAKVAVGLAIAVMCCGAATAKKTTLTVWHPLYGGDLGKNIKQVVTLFEKTNPTIAVNVVQTDVDGEKFLTATAAGSPPDVIFPDGPDVVQWAYKGLLAPLDQRLTASKVKPDDFFGPAYKQCLWKGKVYALPWIADPNFPLIYKKSVFAEVGLAGAPTTVEEMELYATKLDKVDSNGNFKRVGWWPWDIYGSANTFFTLGWVFNASFYDEKNFKVTLNDPKMVKAAQWLFDFGKRHDYARADKFRASASNALLTGKLGFAPQVAAVIRDIEKAKMTVEGDFGWGFFPGLDADGKSAWLGGWTAAIPANAKNKDAAWKFVRFFCHDKAGADLTYKATGFLPAIRGADVFSSPEPRFKPWVEVIKIAKAYRPVMPATPIIDVEANRIMPLLMTGKKSAGVAFDEANLAVQKELDKCLKRGKK